MAVKGRAPFKDAYKSLIGTVVPASAPTMGSACDHSSSWHMTCWGAAAAAFLGATATVALAETAESAAPPTADKGFHLLSLEQRRRHFFKYEKRIRELSSPEKVFEYFATHGDLTQGFTMTPSDIMRSVVPVYPPRDSDIIRAGFLPGEPSPGVPQHASRFFETFDVDSSGGISFDEWLLFDVLLSIPEDEVDVAFALMDHNGNGSVDRQEFSKVLTAIQARASHPSSIQHKINADLMSADGGLVKQFFGTDGKKELTPGSFKKFLAEMREALTRLEFQYYDYNDKGYITARDLALSIVGHARIKHVDGYLDKIDDMPKDLSQKRITYEEFRMLRLVWRRLRQLSVALEFMKSSSGMDFTPDEFIDIVLRVMKFKLPQTMVDVLYHLFGNQNGGLNTAFMMSVMDRSFETGPVIGGDQSGKKSGSGGGSKSFFDCVSECTAKRSNG
ncbi:hypothetical protein Ndes2526B_g00916 [Nannochloris sp. 'desiccata']